ncbi:MAG TPA: cation:proton antiporter [Thermoanaerobaculia bacterium]|nr:cation:proton antiporter [Thermoanaerobaculia bacterium]
MTIGSFLLALIAIFAAAKLFGEIAERLHQPAVLGELIGGAVVGVSGLRLVDPHDTTISLLAQLGIILLLFLIGLDTELEKLLGVGFAAVAVAVIGVALTFAGGFLLGHFLGLDAIVAVFLGGALSATSVGITARVLSDLGHLHDRESQIILAAAVIDDIIGIVLLTLIGRVAEGRDLTPGSVIWATVVAFGFVILAIALGSLLAPRIFRALQRIDVARGLLFASLIFAFALAYAAERVGSAIIVGSFAAGLVLGRTEKAREIDRQVHDIAHFFVPIFFVAVGAAIDVRAFTGRFLLIGIGLAMIAIAGKYIAGLCTPVRGIRRSIVGVGMIPRGEVSLIFAQIGLTSGLLSTGLYNAVAVMVVLTALATPLLLRMLLPNGVPTEQHGRSDLVMDAPMDAEHPRRAREADSPT